MPEEPGGVAVSTPTRELSWGFDVTDDDRDILDCLARLNGACAVLAAGVIEDDLPYDQHLELALQFIGMAERVLKRALVPVAVVDVRPYVIPPSKVEGDAG